MKVCFVSASLYSPPVFSGIEATVKAEVKGLLQRGHQVSVITTSPQWSRSCREIDGAMVYFFRPWNIFERSDGLRKPLPAKAVYHALDHLWNPQPYLVAKGILTREKPDIVHVQNWRGFSPSLFDAVRSVGIPLVLTMHDYSLMCPRSNLLHRSGRDCTCGPMWCRLYRWSRKVAIDRKVDLALTNSQFVANKLRQFGLLKNTPVATLYSTTDLECQPTPAKQDQVFHILYVGKLIQIKGVQVLIEAFKGLKGDNIRLDIVGSGGYDTALRQFAAGDLRITFHGFVAPEGLATHYEQASVSVVPSIWDEPFGNIIFEAFRCGTPVVGSNVGGIPELIENGYNGFLFQRGNASALRETLQKLIDAPKDLEKLRQGAKESAKRFDIAAHVERLMELYQSVLSRKASPSTGDMSKGYVA